MEIKKGFCKGDLKKIANDYNLYYIFSSDYLEKIRTEIIKKFLPDVDCDSFKRDYPYFDALMQETGLDKEYILIGPLRIDYIHGNESNRSLIYLHRSIYDNMVRHAYDKKIFHYPIRVQYYEIRPNNYPGKGFSSNFYIPLPGILDKEKCKRILEIKMKRLEVFGLVDSVNYKITFPVKSRKTGVSTGSAFIEFTNEVETKNKSTMRLLLNDTDWDIFGYSEYRIKCLWARDRQNREEQGHKMFPFIIKENWETPQKIS